MKKILFSITLLLVVYLLTHRTPEEVKISGYTLINNSDSNEYLGVSLQLDSFYNPFLSRAENKDIVKNFPQKDIKILAEYEPIIDKTGTIIKQFKEIRYSYWSKHDVTVYSKINLVYFATNLHVSKDNNVVTFDIPKPIHNRNQKYVLKGIYLHLPYFQSHRENRSFDDIDKVNKYIPIFYNYIYKYKSKGYPKLQGYQYRFTYREALYLEIETDKFVDIAFFGTSAKNTISRDSILKTSVWFENDKPLERESISDEDKNDLFDDIDVNFRSDFADIAIPDSMLNWSDVYGASAHYNKGKTLEVLTLYGLLLNFDKNADRYAAWVWQDGDLLNIVHKFFSDDCQLDYRIIFEKEYPARRYINSEYYRRDIIHKRIKIAYITQENLNIFDKIKQDKENLYNCKANKINEYYNNRIGRETDPDSVKEVNKRKEEDIRKNVDFKNACLREIDYMKRFLTMSKEELKQEFAVYKKTLHK